MANFRDVRPVLSSYGVWAFFARVWQQVNEDGLFVWASALAYSWLFSIFPFLILLLSLVPYLPKNAKATAHDTIDKIVTQMLGKAAPTINANVDSVMNRPHHGWLGIGLAVSLWVASGGMSMTMSALDRCYDVKKSRSYFRQRTLAIFMTIAVVACFMMVIVLLPIGSGIGIWLQYHHYLPWPLNLAFNLARYFLSLFFSIIVLAIIYYFGPNIRQKFEIFSPGAVFSAVVWILLDVVFRFYVDKYARYDQTYGTVGGAAILLLFFYLDGLVLLIGAEINSEIDFERLGVPAGTTTDFSQTRKEFNTKLPDLLPEL